MFAKSTIHLRELPKGGSSWRGLNSQIPALNINRHLFDLVCLNLKKAIEKLQHSLEDQIYNSLRKSYVITNISNNSLFAIPANQEFAYIHRLACNLVGNNTNSFLLAVLQKECSRSKETSGNTNKPQQHRGLSGHSFLSDTMVRNEAVDADLFRKFVFEHVNTALTEGFNDNIGRTNVYPVFELVKPSIWHKVFDCLAGLFLGEPKNQKIASQYGQLKAQIDIDAQFSENRCKKQLPIALNLYQDGLPGHYTKSQHFQRVGRRKFFTLIRSKTKKLRQILLRFFFQHAQK